ncbi:MAG: hypothetical protein IJE27_02090, partial [Anaerotignum sp.]|nr:hypothetical protein [Anaerotignum sp.]
MEENRTNNIKKPASVILDAFENGAFFADGEKKVFHGRETDCIKVVQTDDAAYTITKRTLQNGDVFLFVEGKDTKDTAVEIRVGEIVKRSVFGHLYRKPAFDSRYGENRLTGNSCYLDLAEGSAILSKIYYYREVFHEYENGDVSHILELKAEEDTVSAAGDTVRLELKEQAESFSFAMLLSKEKLFDSEESLLEYEQFLHESIFNNGVWSSWLIRPSGTYTKLPYSIEPFTRDGYGYSLHHSSKKELLPLYRKRKERFYCDMLENAVYQVYLYQKQKNGVFYTDYTSTWLKKDTGIVSPYIDTRLNETFMLNLSEFMEESGMDFGIEPLKDFADYLVSYDGEAYREGEGILYPDYFKDDAEHIAHASLNHQISIANLLYQAYQTFGRAEYAKGFEKIIAFLEATKENWINPETGDLLYGVKTEADGSRVYFGNDYVYVTLGDLLYAQRNYMTLHNGEKNEGLRFLTAFKINALFKTEHDVADERSVPASGELLNSRETVLRLAKEIYPADAVIGGLLEQKEVTDAKDLQEMLFIMKAKQAGFLKQEVKKSRQETRSGLEEQKGLQAEMAKLQAEKAELKEKLEKKTSQFLFEQKKAEELKTKCSGYEARLEMYSKAKMFRLMIFTWKVSGNLKRRAKRYIYGFGHWMYVKLMPYPRLRRVFASLNAKLGIFKDTSKVITYNAKGNGAGTQKKV